MQKSNITSCKAVLFSSGKSYKISNEIKTSCENSNACYLNNIGFDDIVKKANVDNAMFKEIKTSGQKNPTFVYFSKQNIKDYQTINDKDENNFLREIQFPSYCPPQGKNGLKYLSGNNDRPKCQVLINDKSFDLEITHELKIPGKNRIAFFTLTSINGGPTILVASHYIDGGFHDNKSMQKNYQTVFKVATTKTKSPYDQHGFYKHAAHKQELTDNHRVNSVQTHEVALTK